MLFASDSERLFLSADLVRVQARILIGQISSITKFHQQQGKQG
jgi:hypothetical protein